MNRILFFTIMIILGGCTTTPKLEEDALRQVRASINLDDGDIKFTSVAIWIPNSKEFRFSAIEPSVKGVVVITEKSFLFQQWGGPSGLTTVKRIPFVEVRNTSMVTIGRSGRLVIQTNGDKYDSFAASDGAGELSIGAGSDEMHKALVAQLKSHPIRQTY